MRQPKTEYVPWRDRAFVSVNEAAEILARSPEWVRKRIADNRLDGRQLTAAGPIVVTAASVTAFATRAERAVPLCSRRNLELVVDNT